MTRTVNEFAIWPFQCHVNSINELIIILVNLQSGAIKVESEEADKDHFQINQLFK